MIDLPWLEFSALGRHYIPLGETGSVYWGVRGVRWKGVLAVWFVGDF
jgi:hypothetical protein